MLQLLDRYFYCYVTSMFTRIFFETKMTNYMENKLINRNLYYFLDLGRCLWSLVYILNQIKKGGSNILGGHKYDRTQTKGNCMKNV